MKRAILAVSLLAFLGCVDAQVALHTVGGDASCAYTDLQAALDAALPGEESLTVIRVARSGAYGNTSFTAPARNLLIEGGYDTCSDTTPDPATRTEMNQGPQVLGPVLTLTGSANLPSFSLRHVRLAGGDSSGWGGNLYVNGDAEVILENVRLDFGSALFGGGLAVNGGGQATVTVDEDTVITQNSGSLGGGIFCSNAEVRTSAVVALNSATNGAGIYAYDDCSVFVHPADPIDSEASSYNAIIGNDASGDGGGIHAVLGAYVRLRPAAGFAPHVIQNTAAGRGGGVFVGDAVLIADHAQIRQNDAMQDGGGIFSRGLTVVIGEPAPGMPCQLDRCASIEGNTSGDKGGAIRLEAPGSMTVNSAWLFGNSANVGSALSISDAVSAQLIDTMVVWNDTAVSVVDSDNSPLRILRSTLAGNSDQFFDILVNQGSLELRGSIIWETPSVGALNRVGATLTADCLLTSSFIGLPGSATIVRENPLFVFPSTGNYRVSRLSPAIDFCGFVPDTSPFTYDVDGDRRAEDSPLVPNRFGIYDLGADAYSDFVFEDSFETIGMVVLPPELALVARD